MHFIYIFDHSVVEQLRDSTVMISFNAAIFTCFENEKRARVYVAAAWCSTRKLPAAYVRYGSVLYI